MSNGFTGHIFLTEVLGGKGSQREPAVPVGERRPAVPGHPQASCVYIMRQLLKLIHGCFFSKHLRSYLIMP